jgi:mannose-binding lectin 1
MQIRMPPDYHFGITAASAETPDSFEAYKFMLFTSKSISREEPRRAHQPNYEQPPVKTAPDTPASSIDQSKQFEDLHDRLQTLTHLAENLIGEVKILAEKSDGRHQEITRNVMSADRLNAMDHRIQGIEKTVRDYQGQFSSLQSVLKDSHSSLAESLPKHMGDSTYSSLVLSYHKFWLQVLKISITISHNSTSVLSHFAPFS